MSISSIQSRHNSRMSQSLYSLLSKRAKPQRRDLDSIIESKAGRGNSHFPARILESKRGVGLDGGVARKVSQKTTSAPTESFPRPEPGARWLSYYPWVGKTACKFTQPCHMHCQGLCFWLVEDRGAISFTDFTPRTQVPPRWGRQWSDYSFWFL
jgi:hypothetical protein